MIDVEDSVTVSSMCQISILSYNFFFDLEKKKLSEKTEYHRHADHTGYHCATGKFAWIIEM